MTSVRLPNARASIEALQGFRAIIFGIWMIKTALDPFWRLSKLPRSVYTPISFLKPFGEGLSDLVMSHGFLVGLWALILLSCGIAAVAHPGRLRVSAGVVAVASLTLYQNVVRAAGNINHSELTLLMPALFLVAYELMTPTRFGRDPEDDPCRFGLPIVMTLIFAGAAYSFAGVNRFFIGGLDVFRTGYLPYWVIDKSLDTSYFSTFGHLALEYPIMRQALTLSFPVITLLEATGFLAVAWRPFRVPWVLGICSFHLGVLLLMGILFWEPTVALIVFFELDEIGPLRRLGAWTMRRWPSVDADLVPGNISV